MQIQFGSVPVDAVSHLLTLFVAGAGTFVASYTHSYVRDRAYRNGKNRRSPSSSDMLTLKQELTELLQTYRHETQSDLSSMQADIAFIKGVLSRRTGGAK